VNDDDLEIEESDGVHLQDDGRGFYRWVKMRDGSEAIWRYDPAKPPGCAQTLDVIKSR
jgi:hypothetical protein